MNLENLRFPVGRFKHNPAATATDLETWIKIIHDFPQHLINEVEDLDEAALSWIYRPDGWTIQQVVNHCADSHINSIARFKLALTEDNPTIKAYEESLWAELSDGKEGPIEWSLAILTGLHSRWTMLLKNMTADDFKRTLSHPEWTEDLSLTFMVDLYQWHCRHHLAHVQLAKQFKEKMPVLD